MTGDSTPGGGVVGGPVPHVPVMLNEVLSAIQPSSGSVIIDGTFGAGGYSLAMIEAGARVIAIDRDPEAIARGTELAAQLDGQLVVISGRFGQLDKLAIDHGVQQADGVVLDIGVSSMQLDQAERGFSFMRDGPLDMRMAKSGPTAADIVNGASRSDLTRIIGLLGEERQAARISRAILSRRADRPFLRTLDLATHVEGVIGRRPGDRIHPATRTFQALRMFVNAELTELAQALFAAERLLREGGRLVVVTFHSLEDRIVKLFFADRCGRKGGSRHLPPVAAPDPTFLQEKRSAIKATPAEIEINVRSRSAKMRYGLRTNAASREADMRIFDLPELGEIDRVAGRPV